jgi:hypothetical protein
MGGRTEDQEAGLAWQIGTWDRQAAIYWDEIDRRFVPVIDGVMARAGLQGGECVCSTLEPARVRSRSGLQRQ